MEYIKKTVYRILTTGTTTGATNCKGTYPVCTGCTGHCIVLIPNTGVSYYFRILLTQAAQDIGFFDAYNFSGITGTTIVPSTYHVTGSSSSRLTELRKYTVTNIFSQQYISGGTVTTDGVDYPNSISGVSVVYYIGGIKYVDLLTGFTSGTTFSFITHGMTNNPNFINKPIYKDMNKENIISNPEIADDVFIVRQEISAFDKNYRLEYITNLVDLETYAGGAFFNIVNNT
jgi:hypothetical protein